MMSVKISNFRKIRNFSEVYTLSKNMQIILNMVKFIFAHFLHLCHWLSITQLPYSRKYWRELNLAVEPKIAITRILADLNLAVRYGIAIHIYASRKFWRILIWRL